MVAHGEAWQQLQPAAHPYVQSHCEWVAVRNANAQGAGAPDSTRAISRITVVLPTPGRPRNSTELGTAVGSSEPGRR